MSQYGTTTDLVNYGLPATALGSLSATQQNDALVAASGVVDSYYGGRYALPLTAWDVPTTQATCKIAAWFLLSSTRGFNPAAGGDQAVRAGYEDAMRWLRDVQKQQAHPAVTPASNQIPNYNQPFVNSSSVVNVANGCTATNRGW